MRYQKLAICFIILVIFCHSKSFGQRMIYDTNTTNLFRDIRKLHTKMADTAHISFDVTYYLEDVDSVTVRDTITNKFKIAGGRIYVKLGDSIEAVQNDRYFATVYHEDQSIVLQKPQSIAKMVLPSDILDSTFQSAGVTGLTFSDSGSYRKISAVFDSNSFFTNYQICFHKTTYQLLYMKTSARKSLDMSSNYRVNVNFRFSNFSSAIFNDSVFNTDRFFIVYGINDIRRGTSLSTDYDIVNMLGN